MPERFTQSVIALQAIALLSILLAWSVQFGIVFPLEAKLVPTEIVAVVSLLFLPFGIKIVFAALTGFYAAPPIFLAHVLVATYLGKDISTALTEATVGVLNIYIPIALINFVMAKPLLCKITLQDSNISIFRYVLGLAISASILNALFHTAVLIGDDIELIAFRYVVGDVGGTIAVLVMLVLAKNRLMQLVKNYNRS